MGALSDILNPVRTFNVGGAKFEARQVSFGDLFTAIGGALRELGEDDSSLEFDDKIQACIASGLVPRPALARILKCGAQSLDDEDIAALMIAQNLGGNIGDLATGQRSKIEWPIGKADQAINAQIHVFHDLADFPVFPLA